jgi:hypothetical protein
VRFRTQVLNRNQVLLGYEHRRPVRGPDKGLERLPLQMPERLPFPALLQRQERGLAKGQALAPPSGE